MKTLFLILISTFVTLTSCVSNKSTSFYSEGTGDWCEYHKFHYTCESQLSVPIRPLGDLGFLGNLIVNSTHTHFPHRLIGGHRVLVVDEIWTEVNSRRFIYNEKMMKPSDLKDWNEAYRVWKSKVDQYLKGNSFLCLERP
jgi:hypothetical protein